MNEKNFEYLKDQLKYTGFGEALEIELKEKLKQGQPSFTLYHETYPEDRVARATLTFNKAKDSDMYFFNSYKVEMQKENISDSLEHTFYVAKSGSITMKEAQNLMMGRAINKDMFTKEGQGYNGWLEMDFKQSDDKGNFKLKLYHENYGYNLQEALSRYSIKELGNQSMKEDLLRSLKKGNLQGVTFLKDGKEIKCFIQANPQFKTISIYDSELKKIDNKHFRDIKQIDVECEILGESKKKVLGEDKKQQANTKSLAKRRNNRSNKL
jgi:hypothetical protein